ncbi:MAG: dihydroorotase [Clostridia bacterium]|nr:dihydroorotase [Clostridia bacterium]
MSSLLIKNARVINPALSQDFIGYVYVTDDKISDMGEGDTSLPADRVIDATGLICCPGFVDMHVHLRDPGLTYKEDIYTGCNAAAAGGVTSLLAMPNTKPVTDSPEVVEYILNKAKDANARVYVTGAVTKGIEGFELTDIRALKEAGAIALSDDGRPVVDTACLVEAMKAAAELGMTLTCHCEDLYLAKQWTMNEGKTSAELGLRGVPNAAEDSGTAREIAVAAAYGLPVHICHVSTEGACDLIRDAQRRGVKVTGETAAHYLLLTDKELEKKDADYRMNPPLRTEKDRRALIEAIKDGTLSCIITDHAPHSVEEKSDFIGAPNGSIGMETSFSGTYTALVKTGEITINKLVEIMSTNPAKILGIDAGVLDIGKPADIALVNLDEEWVVDAEKLHGKSKNAVLKNMKLASKVKYTVLGGKVVFEDK